MNREQALNILMMLSALESWALSVSGHTLPDYLHDDLQQAMNVLRDIVLDVKP